MRGMSLPIGSETRSPPEGLFLPEATLRFRRCPGASKPAGTTGAQYASESASMRSPVRRRLAVAVAVVIAVTACTGDAHPRGYAASIFFPTYPRSPDGAYPSALLADVKLVEESDCLFGEGQGGGRSLLLWPDGYAP